MKYDDIINLKYPFSLKHSRMSIYKRSSIFAPFAALTCFGEEVIEVARLTDDKKCLTNEEKLIISEKLKYIYDNLLNKGMVNFVYFVSDKRKKGGRYFSKSGVVKKIDLYNRRIFVDNFIICIDDIISVDFY